MIPLKYIFAFSRSFKLNTKIFNHKYLFKSRINLLNDFQTNVVFHHNIRCLSSPSSSSPPSSSPPSSSSPQSPKQSFAELFVSSLPKSLIPYADLMRLSKPTGTWLLLSPCLWSISMATPAGHLPSLSTIALFSAGALIMRGAGCTINDMMDEDYDARVTRTKSRPLAAERLTMKDALMFLSLQLACGLIVLLQFDMNSILLGASSLSIVVTYPLLKRITFWPQIGLGMAFNWGALLGWSVVSGGSLYLPAVLPLYFAGICWTLVYDTIYAHQDKSDDIIIGLKSTAIKFGEKTKQWLSAFSISIVSNLLMSGIVTDQCWPYYGAISIVAAHLSYQIYNLNINDPSDCGSKFKSNTHIGMILFLGIVMSTYLKKSQRICDDKSKSHTE